MSHGRLFKNFFFDQVREYFVDNQHYVVLTMAPKEGYLEESQKVVDEVEKKLIDQLTEDQKAEVIEAGQRLLQDQMENASADSLACLPTLTINDIAEKAPSYPMEDHTFAKVIYFMISFRNC